MILNISNYTDIVQFFTPWLINRFKEGYFCVETEKTNNIYELKPSNFEILAFQTKNPKPIIPYIDMFDNDGYKYFFIVTVTPYSNEIEKNIDKSEIFQTFGNLSKKIGKDRIIWKYAPVILNEELNKEYHYKSFRALCKRLQNKTSSCIVEFIRPYNPPIHMNLFTPDIAENVQLEMINKFTKIAKEFGLTVYSKYGAFKISNLIKQQVITQLGFKPENLGVLDMGLPNTCKGLCEYCCCDGNQTFKKRKDHSENSPLFFGKINKNKKHAKRRVKPLT